MPETFNNLFHYLEKEDIFIDKKEFEFQIKSHPEYPSLLAISDTLSFFTINNVALKVTYSEIDLLPNQFILLLNTENKKPQFYFIEKIGEKYYFTKNNKSKIISLKDIEMRWGGIVLLVEKNNKLTENIKKKHFSWLILTLLICISTLLFINEFLYVKFFFIFSVVGIFFSIGALKDLFGTKNEMLNKFCKITTSTNCTTILSSNKWKIFSYVNFSDLSITFFTTQIVGLFSFLLSKDSNSFLIIQEVLLFCSLPVLFLSLYFQKFVEKKWCPICLIIIGTILLELVYLFFTIKFSFNISINSILLFSFIFLFVSSVWVSLKEQLFKLKDLKEFQLKANRFIRNYEVFKNNLLDNNKIEFPKTPLILGDKESKSIITLITNPFCGHCKGVHKIIDEIITKHQGKIQICLIIKVDLNKEKEDIKFFYRNLMSIYFDKGENKFLEAMSFWFEHKNLKDWLAIYQIENINIMKIDFIYENHHKWCVSNEVNYTPALFINGYLYPSVYDRDNLKFFINDIIDDSRLN